jgi:hypothetical protein
MKPAKPRKTFAEAIEDRLKSLTEVRREKQAAEKRDEFKEQEDEVMLMTHGPDWRRYYAGEPRTKDEVPVPQESEVRLKAS